MAVFAQCPRCNRWHNRNFHCNPSTQWAHLIASFNLSSAAAEEQADIALSRFLVRREHRRNL
jgi:hypothetical protein